MKCIRLLFLFLCFFTACSSPTDDVLLEVDHLQSIGHLELIEYQTEELFMISSKDQKLRDIRSIEEANDFLTSILRAGDRIGIYSFVNYSIGFIDLSHFSPDKGAAYDGDTKHLTLTLPPVQIEPIGRSGTLRKLHERVTGLQREITPEERRKIQNQAVAHAQQRLAPGTTQYKELVRMAETKASVYLTSLFKSRGCATVTIKFEER